MALARRRLCQSQGQAHEASLGHPADYAGVPRGAAHAQACRNIEPLLRPALRGHRRGSLPAARRPRRPDHLPHRAPLPHGRRRPAPHRPLGHHGRPGIRRPLPGGRHRQKHRHPQGRGAAPHLAPLHGALLPNRPPSHRALVRQHLPNRGRGALHPGGPEPRPCHRRPEAAPDGGVGSQGPEVKCRPNGSGMSIPARSFAGRRPRMFEHGDRRARAR